MHPAVCQSFPVDATREDFAQRDKELVAQARAGSGVAFAEIESLYSRRLYQRIFSITRNREDAEDALQDTFLRAYVALGSFEGRSQFASWLTRIAINSALMTLRKRRTRAEVFFDLASEPEEYSQMFDVCDSALNPEQVCEQRQRCYRALRAVRKLHPKLRTPLAIWMKQECSIKEVACALDLSVAAVKARLHRARKRLSCDPGFTNPQRNPISVPGSMRRPSVCGLENREQSCLNYN